MFAHASRPALLFPSRLPCLVLALTLSLTWVAPVHAQTETVAAQLGVRDGRLQPPSLTPNSVSSQAGLYPEHPQRQFADIAPIRFKGPGADAMQQIGELVRRTQGAQVVTQTPGYLHAEMRTRWLKFTDDLELSLDEAASLIHVRSASRLGRLDFGANRKRVELLRTQFEAAQALAPSASR